MSLVTATFFTSSPAAACSRAKQTIMFVLWAVLRSLLTMIVFSRGAKLLIKGAFDLVSVFADAGVAIVRYT